MSLAVSNEWNALFLEWPRRCWGPVWTGQPGHLAIFKATRHVVTQEPVNTCTLATISLENAFPLHSPLAPIGILFSTEPMAISQGHLGFTTNSAWRGERWSFQFYTRLTRHSNSQPAFTTGHWSLSCHLDTPATATVTTNGTLRTVTLVTESHGFNGTFNRGKS